jgi:hypothetical protein
VWNRAAQMVTAVDSRAGTLTEGETHRQSMLQRDDLTRDHRDAVKWHTPMAVMR